MAELTPQMTPEMYAELQNGGQPPVQQPPMNAEVPPQPPVQQTPMGGEPEDAVAQAKEMLGLGETEATIGQLQEQMRGMQTDKIKAEVGAKYADIPYELVEKEIEKIAQTSPQLADAMRSTAEGMDMAYRATQTAITPNEKPDNLTEGEAGGGQGEELESTIKEGKADDIALGNYILGYDN